MFVYKTKEIPRSAPETKYGRPYIGGHPRRRHNPLRRSGNKKNLCPLGLYIQIFQRFNPYSAGIDFSRQNLTSVDVRF